MCSSGCDVQRVAEYVHVLVTLKEWVCVSCGVYACMCECVVYVVCMGVMVCVLCECVVYVCDGMCGMCGRMYNVCCV